jgi:hypothetical protein
MSALGRLFAVAFIALSLDALCRVPAFGAGSVYLGRPALQTTLALVIAGGGPGDYKTLTLVGVLAGRNANAEVAKLTRHYGASAVKQFVTAFDFVIADTLRLAKRNGSTWPALPVPDPTDGKALLAALYLAGVDKPAGTYRVDFMLEHLLSYRLLAQMTKDLDAKYGVQAGVTYQAVLLEMMQDLKAAYSLPDHD